MVLRRTFKFVYPDGSPRCFYGCSSFPRCHGTMALHQDGTVMSTPCDPETKALRHEAHAMFDPLWQRGLMSRNLAYHKLSILLNVPLEKAHLGFCNADQCRKVLEVFSGMDARQPNFGDRGKQNRVKRMQSRRADLKGGLDL